MLEEQHSHNLNEGLQISLNEATPPTSASTEIPFVLRTTSIKKANFPDRALTASPATLHRVSTTASIRNSTASRSDGRLQAYLRDADVFEGAAQQRAYLTRHPSVASSFSSYQEASHRQSSGRPLTPQLDQYSEPFAALDRAQQAILKTDKGQHFQIAKKQPVYTEHVETSRFSAETTESSETIMRLSSPSPALATPIIPIVKVSEESPVLPHGQYALRESICPPANYQAYSLHIADKSFTVPPTPAAKASPFQFQSTADENVQEVDIGLAGKDYDDYNDKQNSMFDPHQNPFDDDHKNKALPGTPIIAYDSVQTHRKSQGFIESPGGHRYPSDNACTFRTEDPPRASVDSKFYLVNGRIQRAPQDSSVQPGYRSSFLEDRSLENIQFNATSQGTQSAFNEKDLAHNDGRSRTPLWKTPLIWGFFIVLLLLIAGGATAAVLLWKHHEGVNANSQIPGGFTIRPANLKNGNTTALGTSIATIAVSRAAGKSGTNYINFHQLASGEIRMAINNDSEWQTSQFVTADAHTGTPITAFTKGNMSEVSLFYFDQAKILQELRMAKDSKSWTKGTIGMLNKTSNAPSGLTAQYVGKCQETGLAWLVYHTGKGDAAQLLSWNEKLDKWSASNVFRNVKQGAGFTSLYDKAVWRFYYADSHSSQLTEQVCPECCASLKFGAWKTGIIGPRVSSKTGGMGAVGIGAARLIYYQDHDGTIREINSTGNVSEEIWATNSSSRKKAGRRTRRTPTKQTTTPGTAIAKAIQNSKMSLTTGVSGKTSQIALFYQANSTDLTMRIRQAGPEEQWSPPSEMPADH